MNSACANPTDNTAPSRFRFPKAERLCSKTLINRLYSDGHRFMVFPYSVQWHVETLDVPCQVLIVAPKRKFHNAVDRNRVKRLTRECFRLHKNTLHTFLRERGISITLSIVYVHTEILPYEKLYSRIEKMTSQLMSEIANESI